MWNGLTVGFKANKNKNIDKREGGDKRNEREREKTVVITTKLEVFASLRLLTRSWSRWRQLVVTCLVFTSSAKSHSHSPAHTSSKGFGPGPMLRRLNYFTNWVSAAWRLLEHAEGIYIPIHCLYFIYFIFIWGDFDWKNETHFFGKLQDDVFLVETVYAIRRRTILELHQFDVVILIFLWHVKLESFF